MSGCRTWSKRPKIVCGGHFLAIARRRRFGWRSRRGGEECAGFALFFTNYSTFLGKPGLYLEDVFVKPHFRRKGIGMALLKKLAAIARERDYGRMEWSVLDWNEPAINFYKKLGAVPLEEWTMFRLTGEALAELRAGMKKGTPPGVRSATGFPES